MSIEYILKLSSYFLSLAMDDLSNFAQNIKDHGKLNYNNYNFSFADESLINDKRGEYIYTYIRLKDGSVIIEYDIQKKQLLLYQAYKGVVNTVHNAKLSDLDYMISKVNEMVELDEISVSYSDPISELTLDKDFGFRTQSTNLLDIVEKSLGIKIPVGNMLGSGAEGEVYDYGNNKVIKLFVLPDNKKSAVLSFLKRLESIKSPYLANVHNSGIVARVGRKLLVGDSSSFNDSIWIAYYIADKVYPIRGERDSAKVNVLKEELLKIGIDPWDFEENPDNIMQDAYGNYLYVDFGSMADFM